MGWYDLFSRFYDKSLEPLYLEPRAAATEALQLRPGQVVLDLPCGTGLSFDGISPEIGEEGCLLGIDRSAGMLARARVRAERAGMGNVRLAQADVHEVEAATLEAMAGRAVRVDRLHVFLGLTAFPRWEEAFGRLWDLLAPGGRAVIVDVHAASPDFQGKMVNLVARADIRRPVWTALEAVAVGYARRDLPSRKEHGGTLFLATGSKPR